MAISDFNTSWNKHTGKEVEDFIKALFTAVKDSASSKVGVLYGFPTKKISEETGFEQDAYYILGFENEEDKERWIAEGQDIESELIRTIAEIPAYASGYNMYLTITPPINLNLATADFNITAYAKSVFLQGEGEPQYIHEQVRLVIDVSFNDGANWENCGYRVINSMEEVEVSMAGLLPTGKNMLVRVTAIGQFATSIPQQFTVSVFNLTLEWASNSLSNVAKKDKDANSVEFVFNLSGDAIKRMYFEVVNEAGDIEVYSDLYIGKIGEMEYHHVFDKATNSILYYEGLFKLKDAYIYNDEDGTIQSNRVNAEFLIGADTDDIAINDKLDKIVNYSSVILFNWNVNTAGTYSFILHPKNDIANAYQEITKTVESNNVFSLRSLATTISIEAESQNIQMTIKKIKDANNLDMDKILRTLEFYLETNANYKPVGGASFILAPTVLENPTHVLDLPNIPNMGSEENIITTSYSGFDLLSDGWTSVDYEGNTLQVLKVPAKRLVTLDYNPFVLYTDIDKKASSFEIEFDFRCYNIVDTEEPIIKIINGTLDGEWNGLVIYPDHALFKTSNHNADGVYWAEGMKTHFALTIRPRPQGDVDENYVRFYVNGIIDREYNYLQSTFSGSNVNIIIGNNSSDIDIYGIKCYKERPLSSRDVISNYINSIPSEEEKERVYNANDIYGTLGISYNSAKSKYNTICHIGNLYNYGSVNVELGGDRTDNSIHLEIHFNNEEDGNSAKLYDVINKGQGTTAMHYYRWNLLYSFYNGSKLVEDFNFPDEGNQITGYAIAQGEPFAKKLVGKVNFASSMQSHKLGLTWAYTDLYKQMVKNGDIPRLPSQIKKNERLAVYQKPFLFFHKDSINDSEAEFIGFMTFGAGKGDKPTFGYSGKPEDKMFMIEGADNDPQLPMFNIPWTHENISYGDETWYLGTVEDVESIDFGFGNKDFITLDRLNSDPDPENPVTRLRNFFNFVFDNTININYAGGTEESLNNVSDKSLYQLVGTISNPNGSPSPVIGYYWNDVTKEWVLHKDISQLYEDITGEALTYTRADTDLIEKVRTARIKNFVKESTTLVSRNGQLVYPYFNLHDVLYHYCFIKFFAGTDNRAKNTYYYTDPLTLEIRQLLDDLDTVLKTDNTGHNTKPYWVEEHTKGADNDPTRNYWSAENNNFYTLLEEAFLTAPDEDTNLFTIKRCMKAMLKAMALLGGGLSDQIMNFMKKYLLSVQDYFPAIAYDEVALKMYEEAHQLPTSWEVAPLEQSNGSQRWSEYQWLKDRIMYISSWCLFGEFEKAGVENSLSWRSPQINTGFELIPAKWLYPTVSLAETPKQSPLSAPGIPVLSLTLTLTAGDSAAGINGVNYYWEVGNLNVKITHSNSPFEISGDRLRKITINPNGTDTTIYWNAETLTVKAYNIEQFITRNLSSLVSSIDLSKCLRLEKVDVRGCTNLTGTVLPQTGLLTEVYLSSPESLSLVNLPNLRNFEIKSTAKLKNVEIKNINMDPESLDAINITLGSNSNYNINNLMSNILLSASKLETLTLENVVNLPLNLDQLKKIISLKNNARVTGSIILTEAIDWQTRLDLYYYSLALENGSLSIGILNDSSETITSMLIGGLGDWNFPYCSKNGQYQLTIVPNKNGTFTSINWSITEGQARITDYGMLIIENYVENSRILVHARLNLSGGGYVEASTYIQLKTRNVEVMDIVYEDSTYTDSDHLNPAKSEKIVGKCFYSGTFNNQPIRLVMALTPISSPRESIASMHLAFGLKGADSVELQFYNNLAVGNAANNNIYTLLNCAANSSYGLNYYGYLNLLMSPGHYITLQYIRQRDAYFNSKNTSLEQLIGNDTSIDEFDRLCSKLKALTPNSAEMRQFFPAFSMCWAYHPICVPEDHETFGKTKWWLPTRLELYNAMLSGCTHYEYHHSNADTMQINYWTCEGYDANLARELQVQGRKVLPEGSSTYWWNLTGTSPDGAIEDKKMSLLVWPICRF